jgi:flagellar biosynthesis protein FlhF
MPQLEFYGETLKECLNQVRDNLGAEAVILETRKVRRGGRLGIGGQEVFCVVAEREDPLPHSAPEPEEEELEDPEVRAIQEVLARMRQSAKERSNTKITTAPVKPVIPTPSQEAAVRTARQAPPREQMPTRLDSRTNANAQTPIRRATFPTVNPKEAQSSATPQASAPKTAQTMPPIRNLTVLKHPQANTPVAPKPAQKQTETPITQNIADLKENLQLLRQRFTDYEQSLHATHTTRHTSHVGTGYNSVRPIGELTAFQDRLEQQGVAPALLLDLLHQLREHPTLGGESPTFEQLEACLGDLIALRFSCAGAIQLAPHRLKTVALVGATGVGKTTTIAKLAAHYALVERRKVALLTIDTYRIAAVEQLKTYSQIIDLPLVVAHHVNEIEPALARFANYDLLLIDTAGRSQHNIPQIQELKPFLEALRCETHLVLSSSTKESDLMEIVHRFSSARIDRLLFSKLDETSTYGTLLNIADRVGIPLSYLTTGQRVPEDISIAEPRSLSKLILH